MYNTLLIILGVYFIYASFKVLYTIKKNYQGNSQLGELLASLGLDGQEDE